MDSKEVELTFIRCPSCKSLMPSSAHKCGMCGLSMEEEETIPTEKKLRLRQRTTSDLAEAKAKSESMAAEEIDPEQSSLEPESFPAEEHQEDHVEDDYVGDDDSDTDGQFNEDNEDDEVNDSNDDDSNDDDSNDQTSESLDSSGEPARKRKRRRRRKKKSPPLESQTEDSQEKEENSEPRGGFNWGSRESAQEIHQKTESNDSRNRYSDTDSAELEIAKTQVEYPLKENPLVQEAEPTIIKTEDKEAFPNSNVNKGAKMNEGNKLLGWFVNYSTESNGKYFEIRVGKKFIGRQELRPHDLIIPDSAISTPHCLLNAEAGKLGLQDLMSDQGTFVKYAGEKDFTRIDSSVVLKHGDVIRLGTFELIVCLVPTI